MFAQPQLAFRTLFAALVAAGLAGCMNAPARDRQLTEAPVTNAYGEETNADALTTAPVQTSEAQPQTAPAPDTSNKVSVTCPEPVASQGGQCFTRVIYPPEYREESTQVLVRPAYEEVTYSEPVYEEVQERVLVREAYMREVEVPALYNTFYTQVLEKPAGKVWKKGRGAVERVDPDTGEIYCLVDQPAQYRTEQKQELVRPAGKRTDEVPAEYTTTTVRKMVKAPEPVRRQVPAEYAAIPKQTLAGTPSCEYVQVLCDVNATPAKISQIEQALQENGYDVSVDGTIDETLTSALREFQSDEGLPETGLMTARTVEALGVGLEDTPISGDQSSAPAPTSDQAQPAQEPAAIR
jgi:Putative peptidoglycan binding domain